MDKISLICTLITTIVGVIPTIVSVIVLVRNIIKNKDWEMIKKIAQEAMTSAEEYAKEHSGMTGEDKLNMALEAVKKGLAAANISFDENSIKKIVEYINQMCAWTKTVNAPASGTSSN